MQCEKRPVEKGPVGAIRVPPRGLEAPKYVERRHNAQGCATDFSKYVEMIDHMDTHVKRDFDS